uniref:Biotin-requiring enzyme n=1 Tax=Candidatus Kentrum eta TaxID=2126337 RepID=A0A450VC57_9GAMM|nr:MAG: Biotin-requiring enzyme [Candidatus Kentron sp. H]VFJ96414.1 MAG: Biotin-requiring enzyme [Candidatus Kentron sp. H]VFK02341.1 MAG: Biotin-requiring enzyme [Candidatus Kentron sp. H]
MEKKFKITVDGKSYTVTVEDLSSSGGMTIPSPGDMVMPGASMVAPDAPPPVPATPVTAGDDLGDDKASPLAGVVVSVDVSVGQQVNAGDIVIVIEAMKMKTKIAAHKSGNVTNIAVKPGDGVSAGQVLLTIR